MGGFINQRDYDLICEIVQSGAPALANNLIAKLSNTINDWQRLKEEENSHKDTADTVKPEKTNKNSK